MNKITTILSAAVLSILIASCSQSEGSNESGEIIKQIGKSEYQTHRFDSLYAMDIPTSMTPTDKISTLATTQFWNGYSEKYMTAIKEDKSTFLENFKGFIDQGYIDPNFKGNSAEKYAYVQWANFQNSTQVKKAGNLKKLKLTSGLYACYREADADVINVPEPITYWLGYIEGKEHMYYVQIWTLTRLKSDFEEEAINILKSFKEI